VRKRAAPIGYCRTLSVSRTRRPPNARRTAEQHHDRADRAEAILAEQSHSAVGEPGDGVTEELVAAAADPGAAGSAGGMSVAQLRTEAVSEGIPVPDQRRTIREPGSIGRRPRNGW